MIAECIFVRKMKGHQNKTKKLNGLTVSGIGHVLRTSLLNEVIYSTK